MRSVDAVDVDSDYRCDSCDQVSSCQQVRQLESQLAVQLSQLYRTDTTGLEAVLAEAGDRFHPRHWLLLSVKKQLINSWGRQQLGLGYRQLQLSQVEDKVGHCRDYITALEAADPGISVHRGKMIWELHLASSFLLEVVMMKMMMVMMMMIMMMMSMMSTNLEVPSKRPSNSSVAMLDTRALSR